ncbi:hypothetical protein QCN29_22990 [Streptomyces sp. HNM0663]|uniref:Uncharacterized protein n=1 Tax=Streptomyces chengmaiensis TaxID=3040919 RepID=A0ABT6HTF6_9ACTN|nr:hypothetical protein [Streptomyces chengmaiensis]MDH2391592.1 hypothetical protein [Streptomyces chengmaiensis]
MSELTVPDGLFDADFVASDEHSLADRFDWIIQDGQIIHAPVVGWTWACRRCGEAGTLPEDPVRLASLHGTQHAAGPFDTLVPLLVAVVRKFPPTTPSSTSYLAELLAEAPPAMTVREWLAARGPVLLGTEVHLALWHMARRRTAEDLVQRWRQTRDAAEAAWEEVLADKIRRHPAYLHPVYPMVPFLVRVWAVDGKRGPFWDGTGVRLVAEDGSELCTFDLGDSPETTAALDALTELCPPRWEEDERDTLL